MKNTSRRVRRARPGESEVLTRLCRRSKAHWGYDQPFMRAHQADLEVTPAFIAAHSTYLLEEAGDAERGREIIGFHGIEPIDDATMDLAFLFVAPEHMGTGAGRALLAHAAFLTRSLRRRYLQIVSDPHAEGFYRKLGAEPVGRWQSPVIAGRSLPILRLDCVDPA